MGLLRALVVASTCVGAAGWADPFVRHKQGDAAEAVSADQQTGRPATTTSRDNPYDPGNTLEGLSFLGIADWGGKQDAPYTTFIQRLNAEAMGTVSASLKPSFVIAAGDNFYEHGLPGEKMPSQTVWRL